MRTRGVERPAIAVPLPRGGGDTIVLDAGANADCKPIHLYQFAWMGRQYAKRMLGIEHPRIGLLSIGEEPGKGNQLTIAAHELLAAKRDELGFCGNIEGQDIFNGGADVVVCDGFVGNITLKVSEGLAEATTMMLKEEISRRTSGKIGYLLLKSAFRSFKKKVDYSEYGGAPLLGINRPCIISHGRSTSRAIKNAIKLAEEFHEKKVIDHLSEKLNVEMLRREKVATQK